MKKTHIILLLLIAASIVVLISYTGDLTTYETIASAREKEGKFVNLIAKIDKETGSMIKFIDDIKLKILEKSGENVKDFGNKKLDKIIWIKYNTKNKIIWSSPPHYIKNITIFYLKSTTSTINTSPLHSHTHHCCNVITFNVHYNH